MELERFPLHLGPGASAVPQPEFTGAMEWYGDYTARHAADGAEGRLVSMHRFEANWDSWEMHPAGDEVVICVEGEISLRREFADGSMDEVHLSAGQYAVNPPGVWHTADIAIAATCLFITAGLGTEHRQR